MEETRAQISSLAQNWGKQVWPSFSPSAYSQQILVELLPHIRASANRKQNEVRMMPKGSIRMEMVLFGLTTLRSASCCVHLVIFSAYPKAHSELGAPYISEGMFLFEYFSSGPTGSRFPNPRFLPFYWAHLRLISPVLAVREEHPWYMICGFASLEGVWSVISSICTALFAIRFTSCLFNKYLFEYSPWVCFRCWIDKIISALVEQTFLCVPRPRSGWKESEIP